MSPSRATITACRVLQALGTPGVLGVGRVLGAGPKSSFGCGFFDVRPG